MATSQVGVSAKQNPTGAKRLPVRSVSDYQSRSTRHERSELLPDAEFGEDGIEEIVRVDLS